MTNVLKFAPARSCVVSLAAILTTGSASGQALTLTKAEHTPAVCDATIKVGDLAKYVLPKPAKPYKIHLSVPSFANPYILAVIYGAERAAKESGVTLNVGAGKGFMDPASQITQLENALSRKPDAVLINPADPAGLATSIDEAIDGGVPVIDVGTLSASDRSDKLVQDDYTQGQRAADALFKLLPSGGDGIVMGGPANASWARRRIAGFLDAIAAHPAIKVSAVVSTDIDPQQGLTKFTNTAQAHPKLDWVYATGSFLLEPQSVPAEYRHAVYVGGGFTNVTQDALEHGTAAAILPDFPISIGYIGVGLAIQKLNGIKIPQHNCAPVDVVTRTDLADPVWAQSSMVPLDWVAPTK